MRVMVIGGRDFDDADFVDKCLTAADIKKPFDLVVPTAFETTQNHTVAWCKKWKIYYAHLRPVDPDGKLSIADRFVFQPDALISFGTDKFTQPLVNYAKEMGVMVWEPKL